ncbi:hypothetical protein [Listeria booriae]|uniref:hypothetical protein n=1 Tax=Listeria booriae TaxID=1552123 RepID=UPI0021AB4F77|nr:hypothetical protein [Listeria booriae]
MNIKIEKGCDEGMLSFEEKKNIFDQYTELEAHPVSMGRINYHFPASVREKKIAVNHLHPNGNAFIYAPFLDDADKNDFVNVREATEAELKELLSGSISFLSTDGDEFEEGYEEAFRDAYRTVLILRYENKMWAIYADDHLEAIFPSREAADSYLMDEGFQ